MSGMSQLKKYPFAYLAALCEALAFGFFFLPMLYIPTIEGERIRFFGHLIAFGGDVTFDIGGSLYSFSFSINILALVLLMCLFLGMVASLLSKESLVNRVAAILLSTAGIVLMFFLPTHSGQIGLRFAYGTYLCMGFTGASIVANGLSFFWRRKKA